MIRAGGFYRLLSLFYRANVRVVDFILPYFMDRVKFTTFAFRFFTIVRT